MAIQYGDNEYIKLFRKMINWEWYTDVNTKVLFLHCLLRANWKDGNWKGIAYKRGQFITSLNTLATETGLSFSQVRTALRNLIKTGEVASTSQGKNRIITVHLYDSYQSLDKIIATSSQDDSKIIARSSQQYKNIKNSKEYKEEREEEPELPPVKISRFATGKYQNVFLSQEEAAELSKEFGLVESQRVIEKLSEYMATHSTKYKDDSHYMIICKWIREDKDKPKQAPKKNAALNSQRQYTSDDIAAIERKKLGLT